MDENAITVLSLLRKRQKKINKGKKPDFPSTSDRACNLLWFYIIIPLAGDLTYDYPTTGGHMDFREYFEKGLTYDEYVAQLGDNLALHQLHYKKFQLPADAENEIKQSKGLNILVITEPWCGDSLAVFPVVRKMAEANSNWGFKIALRDKNPELIDQFPTRGGRAIPIFLFLAQDFSLVFRWGPRPKASQDIFEQYRPQINEGAIEKSEVIK
ncbi:MAG: thioredoxin family protein, partial [bacterium]|nr:thioredoxin family protein [bacterium]